MEIKECHGRPRAQNLVTLNYMLNRKQAVTSFLLFKRGQKLRLRVGSLNSHVICQYLLILCIGLDWNVVNFDYIYAVLWLVVFMLSMCVKLMVRNHGNSYILQSEGGANNFKHTSTYVLSIHIENFQNVLHLKFISPHNLACHDQIIACDRTLILSIVDFGTNKVLSYVQCN